MRTVPRSVVAWRWIVFVLALSQLAAPFVASRLAGNFLSTGVTNEAIITPAGYAFGIWSVIGTLSAATAVAVLIFGLGARWELSMLVNAAVVFTGFSSWLAMASQGWLWGTVAIFVVMVCALANVMWLLVRRGGELTGPAWLHRLAVVTFGLYFGWSSVAVFVNIAAALIDHGWSAADPLWQAAVLTIAAATATALTVWLRATPGHVVAVLWGLIAVNVGALQRTSFALALLAAAFAAVVAVVGGIQFARNRRYSTAR